MDSWLHGPLTSEVTIAATNVEVLATEAQVVILMVKVFATTRKLEVSAVTSE